MAQHDMNIANQGFPATRADLNNALQALVSNSSGTSAPSTTFANQWWYDTTNNKMYIRNEANNAWIEVFTLDQTNNEWQLTTGVIQAKDSDGLALKTDDGTTRLFIKDSDGFIGLGTISPNDRVDIVGSTGDGYRLTDGTRTAVFRSSSDGAILKTATNHDLLLGTNDTERWRITNTGHLKAATNGLGIDFSASEGSDATSSILDDYEEGTWTAQANVGGSNVTTNNTDSTYVRIGRQVFLHGNISFSVGTSTGDVNITGLPYSPAFNGYFRGIMANDFFDESGEFYTIVATTGPKIIPRVGPTGQADGSRNLNGNDIKDNISARIYIGLIYQV